MPDAFEAFWDLYRTRGRAEDRVGAVREWDRLKPDDALIQTMTQALETQSRSETWRRGIGIPYADQSRVFERFYRVDKSHSKEVGGTGLGLSIVKHAAQYHGAKIELKSDPGKGTAIAVNFTAAK